MQMSNRLFLVGVGPGSHNYLTDIVKQIIVKSSYIIGYHYTLSTIRHLLDSKRQNIIEVTMVSQDQVYQQVYNQMKNDEYCTIPFTGDVNFSESEVVDRLLQIFGDANVEMIPGISSIQVAASKAKIPLDQSAILTFHVTKEIEQEKNDLVNAIRSKKSVIMLPRPWNRSKEKQFMESDIAFFLRANDIETANLKVWVFEFLTRENEKIFKGKVSDLENRIFDPLSVMIIDQVKRRSYMDFD
jgi:precorrin-6y C5,15-methyltransferase (decarboxylating) CbiE subunit